MSHDSLEHLIQMANDIGSYFAFDPDHEEAIAAVIEHIDMFWDPRMRRRIFAHVRNGGEGLDPLPMNALRKLADATAGETS